MAPVVLVEDEVKVAAIAPHPALNNVCCPFLRKYQIGLADAEIFSTEMEKSYKAFKAKPRRKLKSWSKYKLQI